MKEHEYQRVTANSGARYKDVETINFTPVKEIKMKKVLKKGQVRFWKWLGLMPLIPYKVRHDRYTIDGRDSWLLQCQCSTIEAVLSRIREHSNKFFFEDGKPFQKAEVCIVHYASGNKRYEYEYFRTNHEAMNYFNTVKSKCEEVGNMLK